MRVVRCEKLGHVDRDGDARSMMGDEVKEGLTTARVVTAELELAAVEGRGGRCWASANPGQALDSVRAITRGCQIRLQ